MSVRIIIALSTFNGAKYLPEQLESIRSIQSVDWRLFIRDDGSSDGTVDLLKSISSDPRITILDNSGIHLGVKNSYSSLILRASEETFDFLAFSDQDDIWLSNRFDFLTHVAVSEFPVIHYGRALLVNASGQPIGTTRKNVLRPQISSLYQNFAIGCATVVNKPLVEHFALLLLKADIPVLHDWVAYCIAAEYGLVFPHNEIWLKYRQHDSNDTGYTKSKVTRMTKALCRVKKGQRNLTALRIAEYISSSFSPNLREIFGGGKVRHWRKVSLISQNQLLVRKGIWVAFVILFGI